MVDSKTNRVLPMKNSPCHHLQDDLDDDEHDDILNDNHDAHPPLEEGEAVLSVPVVGFVPHPIVPGQIKIMKIVMTVMMMIMSTMTKVMTVMMMIMSTMKIVMTVMMRI